MMLRQIITPSARDHTVVLPEELYGKSVEITVVEIDDISMHSMDDLKKDEVRAFFNSINVDMTKFKFDREEANER